ncbi:MAG: type II toxin-antitoxin system PemK/MazF family toxin [Elainellaceae cyanobacterium]
MDIRRGAVIRVNLNPTLGREQSGDARPCLIISNSKFNAARGGIVVAMPITSTIKPEIKVMVPVLEGFKVRGSIIAEQVRTLALSTRWWRATVEVLPKDFVDRVVGILSVIVD